MHKSKALAEVCINLWTYTLHPHTFLWVMFTPGCTEVHRTLGALPYCCGAGRGHWKDTERHQEDTERTLKTPGGHWIWLSEENRQVVWRGGHKNGIAVCVQKTGHCINCEGATVLATHIPMPNHAYIIGHFMQSLTLTHRPMHCFAI